MATASPSAQVERPRTALVVAVGAAVAVVLGVYGRVHDPALQPLVTLGFSGMLQMKAWLATFAVLLVVVQLVSALWMWGRLPLGPAPAWNTPVHRWSGTVAFVVSLPVALHCLWSLGLDTSSPRVLVHGVTGCCFYGAYAAKMLGLRVSGLPSWALPVLGGLTFGLFVLVWLTSALWFFTRSGVPLT
jgi:hypothetical protein